MPRWGTVEFSTSLGCGRMFKAFLVWRSGLLGLWRKKHLPKFEHSTVLFSNVFWKYSLGSKSRKNICYHEWSLSQLLNAHYLTYQNTSGFESYYIKSPLLALTSYLEQPMVNRFWFACYQCTTEIKNRILFRITFLLHATKNTSTCPTSVQMYLKIPLNC